MNKHYIIMYSLATFVSTMLIIILIFLILGVGRIEKTLVVSQEQLYEKINSNLEILYTDLDKSIKGGLLATQNSIDKDATSTQELLVENLLATHEIITGEAASTKSLLIQSSRETQDVIAGESANTQIRVIEDLREAREALAGDSENTQYGITELAVEIKKQGKKSDSIESIFIDILEEQKKQHISTIQSDTALIEKVRLAKQLFDNGEYVQSAALWNEISVAQPNNFESRFYAIYTSYLINPMDSSLYDALLKEFDLLKNNGYQRDEMDEVTDAIEFGEMDEVTDAIEFEETEDGE